MDRIISVIGAALVLITSLKRGCLSSAPPSPLGSAWWELSLLSAARTPTHFLTVRRRSLGCWRGPPCSGTTRHRDGSYSCPETWWRPRPARRTAPGRRRRARITLPCHPHSREMGAACDASHRWAAKSPCGWEQDPWSPVSRPVTRGVTRLPVTGTAATPFGCCQTRPGVAPPVRPSRDPVALSVPAVGRRARQLLAERVGRARRVFAAAPELSGHLVGVMHVRSSRRRCSRGANGRLPVRPPRQPRRAGEAGGQGAGGRPCCIPDPRRGSSKNRAKAQKRFT